MRILHVSTNFKPLGSRIGYGGVERIVGWLGDQQRADGHEVFVGTVEGSDYPDAIQVFRPDLHVIKETEPVVYRTLMTEAFQKLLVKARDLNVDLIHDHMGVFATHLAITSQASWPIIVSVYAQPRHYAYVDVLQALSHARDHAPWLVVTASSLSHKRQLEETIAADFVVHTAVPKQDLAAGERIACLCMAGVRPDKQQLELARLAVQAGLPFIFAGPLLCPDKAHQDYADEFLRTVGAQIELEHYSDDHAYAILKEAIQQHRVVFVSEIVRDSLRELLFSLCEKLVLLNCTEEVFSLVLLEAIARGITVVSGPFSSAYESVQGFGHVVRDLSTVEVLRALRAPRLSSDSVQRFSRARFPLANYSNLIEAVYIDAERRFRDLGKPIC